MASFERCQGHTGILTVVPAPFLQEIKYSLTEQSDVMLCSIAADCVSKPHNANLLKIHCFIINENGWRNESKTFCTR